MGTGRLNCAAVSAGGRVVVVGGWSGGSALDTTLLLDAQTMAFTDGPNLLAKRRGCAAVLIDADRLLVVGGCSGIGRGWLNTTEILHLSTRTVTPGPTMQSARSNCAAVALDARRILVVGGFDGRSYLSTTEILSLDTILDVRTMAFAPGPFMGSARAYLAAVAVDQRHVILVGGYDSASMPLATTKVLDVVSMEFSPGPQMQARRAGFSAARLDTLQGPRIVLVGGQSVIFGPLTATEVLASNE
jgi:hypothetical protein